MSDMSYVMNREFKNISKKMRQLAAGQSSLHQTAPEKASSSQGAKSNVGAQNQGSSDKTVLSSSQATDADNGNSGSNTGIDLCRRLEAIATETASQASTLAWQSNWLSQVLQGATEVTYAGQRVQNLTMALTSGKQHDQAKGDSNGQTDVGSPSSR